MQIEDSQLYKELVRRSTQERSAEDLRARLSLAVPTLQKVLSEVRVYFRHFTDHSLGHSVRIVRNIESFLTEDQYKRSKSGEDAISSVDIYLILATALLHDIGMVIQESELDDFAKREDFKSHVARYAAEHLAETSGDWQLKGVARIAVADYVRKHHPTRVLQMVLDGKIIPSFLVEGRLGHWIGTIAAGHGMSFEQICNTKTFPTRVQVALPSGVQEPCNPRFVALCLRLGDLLDINTARACPTLRSLSEPLPSLSEHHWRQYDDIEIQGLAPGSEICVAGTCPTQDADRLLRDWVAWLEKEAADATLLQNQDQDKYRLHLGRVTYRVEPKKLNGVPVYEFTSLRFNLDERMVFERLFGKSLYGRTELALREVVQNAIDAQRARLVNDLSSECGWSPETPVEERLVALRKRIRERRTDFAIQVSTRRVKNGADEEVWLSIADRGIGMSRETIQNYLLKVGRSRWSNDPTVARLGLGNLVVGAFGVGFLSTLMIADRVVVETRSCLPDETGIRVTVYGWQGFAATQRVESLSPGTKISLRLSRPFCDSDIELAQIIASLIPLPDFPIIVEGTPPLEVPSPRVEPPGSRRSAAKLDDEGSVVLLADHKVGPEYLWQGDASVVPKLGRTRSKLRLCQDGIAVPEMALPNDPHPSVRILDTRNLLLDLRGGSRVPLDLSRNLVEGGNESFWPSRIELIWDAIGTRFSSDSLAARTIGQLANELIALQAERRPLVFVSPLGQILRIEDVVGKHPKIVCIDAFRHDAGEMFAKEGCVALVVPDSPLRDYAMQLFEGALQDDDDDSGSRRDDDEESEVRRPNTQGVLLDDEWQVLLASFPWLGPGRAAPTIFNGDGGGSTIAHSSVFGFRVSWSWVSIFHPVEGEYRLLPFSMMEGLSARALDMELSLEEFFLFLMRWVFDAPFSEWKIGTGMSEVLSEAAALLERADELIDLDDEDDEEEQYGEDWSEEEEDRDDSTLMELEGALREWGADYRGIAAKLRLKNVVLPWEAKAWSAGAFEGGTPKAVPVTKKRAPRKRRLPD